MNKKNISLFDEFIKGISANAFGTSAEAEKPFPMTDSLPLWYDLFIEKTYQAFKKIEIEKYQGDKKKLLELLPPVSNLRFILYKMMRSYVGLSKEKKESEKEYYKYVFNFLLEAIHMIVPIDSYCHHSNLLFTQEEADQLLENTELKSMEDIKESKLIARLNLGLMSVVHGLYNDIVTDFGVDVYGPYNVSLDNKEYVLMIKHFPLMNPKDLNWPDEFIPNVSEVYLYLLYEGMEWEIKGVGCHTNILKGTQ